MNLADMRSLGFNSEEIQRHDTLFKIGNDLANILGIKATSFANPPKTSRFYFALLQNAGGGVPMGLRAPLTQSRISEILKLLGDFEQSNISDWVLTLVKANSVDNLDPYDNFLMLFGYTSLPYWFPKANGNVAKAKRLIELEWDEIKRIRQKINSYLLNKSMVNVEDLQTTLMLLELFRNSKMNQVVPDDNSSDSERVKTFLEVNGISVVWISLSAKAHAFHASDKCRAMDMAKVDGIIQNNAFIECDPKSAIREGRQPCYFCFPDFQGQLRLRKVQKNRTRPHTRVTFCFASISSTDSLMKLQLGMEVVIKQTKSSPEFEGRIHEIIQYRDNEEPPLAVIIDPYDAETLIQIENLNLLKVKNPKVIPWKASSQKSAGDSEF